jgi:hypothetical protein
MMLTGPALMAAIWVSLSVLVIVVYVLVRFIDRRQG